MGPLEYFSTFRPEYFHQEEDEVRYVALDQLVDETGPVDLDQDRINLVCLRAHILKDIVHSACV